MLFSMGSLFAIYEGVEKLRHPHELVAPQWAIGVLLLAIALEAWSFRTAFVEANAVRGDQNLWRFIRRAKSPELPVVLLEDTGALLGLVFALLGVGLAIGTGDARFDALGSVAIGILLACIAFVLAAEMKSLLIGESATPDVQQRIRAAIESSAPVSCLIHLRTLHLGPDELLVGAKVEFSSSLDLPGLARAIDEVEARVRAVVAEAHVIYIEPDVHRST